MSAKIHKYLYYSLFGLLLVSLIFVLFHITGDDKAWNAFVVFLSAFSLFNVWYVFISLYVYDARKKTGSYHNELISIILPCFNEKPELLEKTVDSVFEAKGNKELIIIDDGSNDKVKHKIREIIKRHPEIKIFFFPGNRGKRHALYHAVKNLVTGDYTVTIDSDTVLDKDSLVQIVTPLSNNSVGAVSGHVELLNERENFLTRLIGAYYWVALKIGRKAESAFGNVACCSGCIAAYRTKLLREIINIFANQTFLGKPCTHSEDRHLTNLVLQRGYKVVFNEKSIVYTETPSTLGRFLKQQLRWKRGYIREVTYCLTFSFKRSKLLFYNNLRDILLIFFSIATKIVLIFGIIFDPKHFLLVILPSWVFLLFVKDIFLVLKEPRKIAYLFFYVLLNEFILSWQYIPALFTVKNKSWITRADTKSQII